MEGHTKSQDTLVKCPICQESFPFGTNLVEHVNNNHDEKNVTTASLDDEIRITTTESTDNEIKITYDEDEDVFSLPPQFTKKLVTNNGGETTMIVVRSIQKSMLFARATVNLEKIIQDSAKIEISDTRLEVIYLRKQDNTVEATIEVSDKEGKGNVRLQIWGPKTSNKRSGSTVQMTKI